MEFDKLKVLNINTFDIGGAANACIRLHIGLLEESIDSKLLLKNKYQEFPESYQYIKPKSKLGKTQNIKKKVFKRYNFLRLVFDRKNLNREKFINYRHKSLEYYSFPETEYDLTENKLYKEADIVHLHWVADFIDFSSFFKKNKKPVVWTLHDMNPFSGGEHYKESYLGISPYGEPVPRKISKREQEVFDINIKKKFETLRKESNLCIVAPSKWLYNEAKNSKVFWNKKVSLIPYGLNKDVFRPENKKKAREELGLPLDKKIILFVAHSLDNNRKGFAYLKKALQNYEFKDAILCSIGKEGPNIKGESNCVHLGEIKNESVLRKVYSAADVFVIPSLMDNLPNTVLESLFCGTPVIGFPVGGIPDMIDNGVNGFLTDAVSVDSLIKSLRKFMYDQRNFDSELIRANAVKKFNHKKQTKAYLDLYKSLV